MMVTSLPNNKPTIGKLQTNRIINGVHGHGAHNPQTNPNDSNYVLGVL